jgi:hypothetical protein
MSRISFTTDTDRWHVGWDPAVASYYAQVEPPRLRGRGDVDDQPVTVVGGRVGEAPTVADLDRRLAGRVQLPDGVREQLAEDGPATPAAERLPGWRSANWPSGGPHSAGPALTAAGPRNGPTSRRRGDVGRRDGKTTCDERRHGGRMTLGDASAAADRACRPGASRKLAGG